MEDIKHKHTWKKVNKIKYIPLQGKVKIIRVCNTCGIFELSPLK